MLGEGPEPPRVACTELERGFILVPNLSRHPDGSTREASEPASSPREPHCCEPSAMPAWGGRAERPFPLYPPVCLPETSSL